MRAFLSHSSEDKSFVGAVAQLLGRSRVIYDVYEFSTGDEFLAAIERGIERSGVFVLFAVYGWWHWQRGLKAEGSVRVEIPGVAVLLRDAAVGVAHVVLQGRASQGRV